MVDSACGRRTNDRHRDISEAELFRLLRSARPFLVERRCTIDMRIGSGHRRGRALVIHGCVRLGPAWCALTHRLPVRRASVAPPQRAASSSPECVACGFKARLGDLTHSLRPCAPFPLRFSDRYTPFVSSLPVRAHSFGAECRSSIAPSRALRPSP